MCGLVGMAGNLNTTHSKMFRDMLIFDQVRGLDSTGIAVVGMAPGAKPVVEKAVGTPNNLWEYGDSKLLDLKGVLKACPKVVIGHNRAATIGSVTVENAHPFEFEHIVGVHNGSLTYYDDLEGAKKHDVDSKAIYDTISQKGIDHTWKSFYGAAALVWWDSKEETLNIIRNSQRPLHVAQSESGDAIFWASEMWMIMVAADRHNIRLKKNENDKVLMATPKENHLYVYKPTSMKCPMMEVRELEKKTYTPPATTSYGTGGTHGRAGFYSSASRGGNNSPITGYFDALPWKLKTGWAQGWERAEKEAIGTEFKLVTVVDTQEQGYRSFYIYGQTKDGDRVEVFPCSVEEHKTWSERAKYRDDYEIWFKFTRRPRMKRDKLNGHAPDTAGREVFMTRYRVGSDSVSFSRSIPRKGVTQELNEQMLLEFEGEKAEKKEEDTSNVINLTANKLYKAFQKSVSEKKWHELMSHSSIDGGCTCCGNPIGIEQHRDIMWLNDHCVLCETCQQDPTIINYLQHYTG